MLLSRVFLGILFPCVIAAGMAQGATTIRFMGGGNNLDAAGWQGGVIPGDPGHAWGDKTVTVSDFVPDIGHLQTGLNESVALITTTGGGFTSEGWSMTGTAGGRAIATSIQPGSLLDIRGTGEEALPRNFVGSNDDYSGNSGIVGNGVLGGGALRGDLTTNPGFTKATVLPEPSAASLIRCLGAAQVLPDAGSVPGTPLSDGDLG